MSNTYQLCQKIHELLPKINQKYGLEIKVDGYHAITKEGYKYQIECGDPYIFVSKSSMQVKSVANDDNIVIRHNEYAIVDIRAPQLRQILIGLKDVLGENPILPNTSPVSWYKDRLERAYFRDHNSFARIEMHLQTEAICQRWLDGLNPLFDREPEQVLTGLVEILENLLK